MSIDAMKQALEALEELADEVFAPYDNKLGDAILALRAAIEQRKPVAWRKHYENSGYTYYDARWKNIPQDAEPLYL